MMTEYKVTDLRIVGDWFVYLMHPTYDVKWRMRNEGRIPRILQNGMALMIHSYWEEKLL